MNCDSNHKVENNNSICNKARPKHNSKLMEPILHLHSIPVLTDFHQEKIELTSYSSIRNEDIGSKHQTAISTTNICGCGSEECCGCGHDLW